MSKELKIERRYEGTVIFPDRALWENPTRACLVCGCLEDPSAMVVRFEIAWLCNRCKSALLKVAESEDE